MRAVLFVGVFVSVAYLAFWALLGSGNVRWNQRPTLVIETPDGEVRGSVVQRIDWEGAGALGKAMFSSVDSSLASERVTGEALAVE